MRQTFILLLLMFREAHFGQGLGPIFLDGIECEGTEHGLAECYHRGWEVHSCSHEEDASLVCEQYHGKQIHHPSTKSCQFDF